ncbi:MAG: thioredoxin-like domain-containing protein [Aurantibacter sp.]
MKKILLPLIIIAILAACNTQPEGFTINGTLTGEIEDSTKVFLTKIGDQRQRVDLDTAFVKDGKFVFNGIADSTPVMRYIFVDKLSGYTAIVLENGEIQITGQKDSLSSAKAGGTLQNDFFTDYLEKSRDISRKAISIQRDMQEANINKDSVTLNSLQDEMAELQEEANDFELKYIKENPNSLIAAFLIDRVLAQRQMNIEEVTQLYDGLTPEIKKTKVAKGIFQNLEAMRAKEERSKSTEVGAKAPGFSAPTPSGEQLALNDVMGKVTLVDFWAAWCKPCRAENPNVVNVYKKYHDKGLNIVGVSLDRRAEDWKKAIADDGLTWNHVSHVQYFNDPIAKLYNVDAIPAAFLLDENGIIVAKNLRGPALEQKVAELLN